MRLSRLGWALAGAALLLGGRTAMGQAPGHGDPPAVPSKVRWASSLSTAMQQAQAEQKFVMADLYTGWCYWCKVLDAKTYSDEKVGEMTARMVSVKIDAEADRPTANKYGVQAYPTILFLNPDGSLRRKIQGFQPPENFVGILQDVFQMDSELFALSHQVSEHPKDPTLRHDFAQALARSGDLHAAAAQTDTLLLLAADGKDTPLDAQLDRWIYLQRAGDTERREDTRKGLQDWVKKAKGHPRLVEGEYFLAQACEADGHDKDAQKIYREITRKDPGSWFAEVARAKVKK